MFQLYCVEYKEWWNPEEEEIVIQPRKQEANQITNGNQKEQVTHITIVSRLCVTICYHLILLCSLTIMCMYDLLLGRRGVP